MAFGNTGTTANTVMRVPEKGAAAVYCLQSNKDPSLQSIGYRNGSNRVASLITNDPSIDVNVWDVDNRSPPRPLLQLTFEETIADHIPVHAVSKETIHEIMGVGGDRNKLMEITSHQNGCQMWHICRRFLLTSSTVHFLISVLPHRFYEVARELSESERNQYRKVIAILGNQNVVMLNEQAIVPDFQSGDLRNKTVPELASLCSTYNLKPSGSKTKEMYVKTLTNAAGLPVQPRGHTFTHAMMSSWFPQPLATGAMTMGLNNQYNVLSGLKIFLEQSDPDNRYHSPIVRIDSYGLVRHVESACLATSVDAVVAMRSSNGLLAVGAIEVKTRTTTATVSESTQLAHRFGAVSGCAVKADNEHVAFHERVPVVGDRIQLLHHSSVFDIESVFYVEASSSGIIRVVHITFSADVRSIYRSVISQLYQHVTGCDKPENFVVTDVDRDFSNERCPDIHTLRQCHAIWLDAMRLVAERGSPLGDCRSVRPFLVNFWNKAKAPVDSISQYLASTHPAAMKDRPSEFAVVERFLTYALLSVHLTTNLLRIDPNRLQSANDTIGSVRQLRQLAIGRENSFKGFLSGSVLEYVTQMAGANLQPVANRAANNSQQLQFTPPEHGTHFSHVRELFASPAGQAFLLGSHPPCTVTSVTRHRCLICKHLVSSKCKKCTYFFCIDVKLDANNVEQPTCWDVHHNSPA